MHYYTQLFLTFFTFFCSPHQLLVPGLVNCPPPHWTVMKPHTTVVVSSSVMWAMSDRIPNKKRYRVHYKPIMFRIRSRCKQSTLIIASASLPSPNTSSSLYTELPNTRRGRSWSWSAERALWKGEQAYVQCVFCSTTTTVVHIPSYRFLWEVSVYDGAALYTVLLLCWSAENPPAFWDAVPEREVMPSYTTERKYASPSIITPVAKKISASGRDMPGKSAAEEKPLMVCICF